MTQAQTNVYTAAHSLGIIGGHLLTRVDSDQLTDLHILSVTQSRPDDADPHCPVIYRYTASASESAVGRKLDIEVYLDPSQGDELLNEVHSQVVAVRDAWFKKHYPNKSAWEIEAAYRVRFLIITDNPRASATDKVGDQDVASPA